MSDDDEVNEPLEPQTYESAMDRIKELEAALKVCHQALLETAHAQEVGASWYTHTHDGLYRQVHMWVRNGLMAIKKVRVSA